MKQVVKAHHWQDHHITIVPDIYTKWNCDYYPNPSRNYKQAKDFYLNQLERASSNKMGCRKYVKHSFYMHPQACFPNAFMIDSSTIKSDEEILLCVVVHKLGCNHINEQCTIHIQQVSDSVEWDQCREVSLYVGSRLQHADHPNPICHKPLTQQECINAGLPFGFDGNMYAVGKHVHQYEASRNYREYSNTHAYHPQLCIMLEMIA